MGNDRHLFTADPEGLPVYEGRMVDHFDHRAKTYHSGHGNSARWIERAFGDQAKAIVPQWRVLPKDIPGKLGDRCERYRIGFGDVANPRNERSFMATLIPPGTICGHSVPTIVFEPTYEWAYLPWLAVANSFVMDALARKKLSSSHMTFTLVDSLPFPRRPLEDPVTQALARRVLRLVCVSVEMTPFWNRMAALGLSEPVAENTVPASALVQPSGRSAVRAELDALVARQVFGLSRDELGAVMDAFPVVKRRDEKQFGAFRTKDLILAAFDSLPASSPPGLGLSPDRPATFAARSPA